MLEKAIKKLKSYGIKEKDAKEEFNCLSNSKGEAKKVINADKYAKKMAKDIAMVKSMEGNQYYKEVLKKLN